MQLRDHPLMTYHGIRTWPPVWTLIRGTEKEPPKGEVGVLKEINVSAIPPPADADAPRSYNRIFMFIDHGGQRYLGCLMLEDYAFCQEVAKVLRHHFNRTIQEIGSIELEHTM
ncbi:MAG TPA: hypothetical protein VKH64_15570 [Candidatus Binatia bacterium]|nr:hypothetical protein [Candidatus Binatia bacterium]